MPSQALLDAFQDRLAYRFQNLDLLRAALTHRSFHHEAHGASPQDNERLEFLGDSILGLIVGEYLVAEFPRHQEGDLSKAKGRLVSGVVLAKVARSLRVGEVLCLGRGEEMTKGREKSSLLANALEAVIAAVYLDCGFQHTKTLVLRWLRDELRGLHPRDRAASGASGRDYSGDYKGLFQQWCQRSHNVLPSYKVLSESGPHHAKVFEVQVAVQGTTYGVGWGRTKKEAEQEAARTALDRTEGRTEGPPDGE